MTSLQKVTLITLSCLILTFILSIGLAWFDFGYLDTDTVLKMMLMLLPLLAVAAVMMILGQKSIMASEPEILKNDSKEKVSEPQMALSARDDK